MTKALSISILTAVMLITVSAAAQNNAVVVPLNGFNVIPICHQNRDCNGDCDGKAYVDSCNICVGGNTSKSSQVTCVTSSGQIWMDRNLGAVRVAVNSGDSAAYGDLYQWGRLKDGHENRVSSTIGIQSGGYVPGHADFIIGFSDWRNPSDDNLWQDSGINNPCPTGFRLPTETEWGAEMQSWSSKTPDGAFSSPLRLVVGGYRKGENGTLKYADLNGSYWSSTTDGYMGANGLHIYAGGIAGIYTTMRAYGLSVRCLRD